MSKTLCWEVSPGSCEIWMFWFQSRVSETKLYYSHMALRFSQENNRNQQRPCLMYLCGAKRIDDPLWQLGTVLLLAK